MVIDKFSELSAMIVDKDSSSNRDERDTKKWTCSGFA